jgi:hypothetical protein
MVFSPSGPHHLVDYTLTPSHRISLSISLSRATGPISHPKAAEAAPAATKEVKPAAEAAKAAMDAWLGALLGSICAPNTNATPYTCLDHPVHVIPIEERCLEMI